MAKKDTSIKYKPCKFDPETNKIVEYLKDKIVEHDVSDIFEGYDVDGNRYFNLTLAESVDIIPETDSED